MEEIEITEMSSSTDALHRAVRAGDVALVTILLQEGALVNARDSYSRTALHVACQYADFQSVIVELLRSGAEVNSKDWKGETPLHGACRKMKESAVATLLRNGADVRAVNLDYETALHVVVGQPEVSLKGRLALLDALLTNYTDESFEENSSRHHLIEHPEGNKTVHVVNQQDRRGNTALHLAVARNEKDVACLLLRRGAKAEVKNSNGLTAFTMAVKKCHPNVGDLLGVLVDNGADVNAQDPVGYTSLHLASMNKDKDLVRLLLRMGAKIELKNNHGESALHVALRACAVDIVYDLVDSGANVNARDSSGNTSLHLASVKKDKDVVRLLLRMGAKVGLKNNRGNTALREAVGAWAEDIVYVLVDVGERFNAKDYRNNIPLHLCALTFDDDFATSGWREIVSFLIIKGLKANEQSMFLKTSYEIISGNNFFKDMIDVLFVKKVIGLKMSGLQEELVIKKSCGVDFFDKVRVECQKELEDMKSTKVVTNVSLYQVLSRTNQSFLLSNDDLLVDEFLSSPDLLTRFPIYGHTLRITFQRAKLLTLAVNSFYSEGRKQMVKALPCLVVEHLLTFLNNKDLSSFISSE